MSFLAPIMFWIAAAAIPALLILYFLKLRRRQETVPSTLLWRRAVQDLQVNAPFQRLRKNLLLFLQLLVLCAAIFALARPIVQSTASKEKSVIILIDRSGSMNTKEGDQTRLDLAKEQAKRLVRTLNQTGGSWFSFAGPQDLTRVMVIAFADRASVISPFTTNVGELPALIDAIQPSDARTNLREALDLAEAYMQVTRTDMRPNAEEAPSRLVMFSDGGVADLRQLVLRSGTVELIPIGATADNAAVTALRAQRNYERPERVEVFVQVSNFAPEPLRCDLSIYGGESVDSLQLMDVQAIELGAARRRAAPPESQPGEPAAPAPQTGDAGPESGGRAATTSVTFEVELPEGRILEARLSREDGLAIDNRAWIVVPPPRKLRVLLVSKGNFFLESVLAGLPLQKVDYLTPEQYESAGEAQLVEDGRSRHDLVIFDKHDTARLPIGNYLFIGGVPKVEGIERGDELGDHALMWWDETHPILRNVALDFVVIAGGFRLKLPDDAEIIAEGPQGPAIARVLKDSRQFLLMGFAIENGNWWTKQGFPIFAYNTIPYLGSGGATADVEPTRPGDTVRVPLPATAETAIVTRPDGATATIKADATGVARYAGTDRVGVYTVDPAVEGHTRFAVNLEDAVESDIAPREELKIGDTAVQVGKAIETATPEIWRWFIGAALVVALIEWYIYNRRVML